MRKLFMRLCVLTLIMRFAAAQKAPAPQLFDIGVTDSDLYARFGQPQRYFCVKSQRYVTAPQLEGASANDTCRPVYSRKTERNEYEIVLFLEADSSQSRLHPVQRVKEVRFTFDHDMTAFDAISDIPEAKRLCQESCAFTVFYGMDLIATPKAGNPQLMFHPAKRGTTVTGQTPMASVSLSNLSSR